MSIVNTKGCKKINDTKQCAAHYTILTVFCPDVISGLNQLYTEFVEVLECVMAGTPLSGVKGIQDFRS